MSHSRNKTNYTGVYIPLPLPCSRKKAFTPPPAFVNIINLTTLTAPCCERSFRP